MWGTDRKKSVPPNHSLTSLSKHGVSLSLCCFVVYSKRPVVLCLTLYYFVLVFSVLLALRLPRLGKRELILVLFVLLFDLCLFGFVGFPFLLVSGKSCGLGTPWTFLLLFFFTNMSVLVSLECCASWLWHFLGIFRYNFAQLPQF